MCVLCRVRLFATPRTTAWQAPLSMGFSRQECWTGLPFPPPGDLPDPGIKPGIGTQSFYRCATWEAHINMLLPFKVNLQPVLIKRYKIQRVTCLRN